VGKAAVKGFSISLTENGLERYDAPLSPFSFFFAAEPFPPRAFFCSDGKIGKTSCIQILKGV
jgi:hypothetical protein